MEIIDECFKLSKKVPELAIRLMYPAATVLLDMTANEEFIQPIS